MPAINQMNDLNKYIGDIEAKIKDFSPDSEIWRKMLVSLENQILLGQQSVKDTENMLQELQRVVKRLGSIRDRVDQNCVDTQSASQIELYHIKNLKYMREKPPPKYVEGTNVYVHLAMYVEKYINSYKLSRSEIVHCLSLVFEDSVDTSKRVEKICMENLPESSKNFKDRKATYLKISRMLGESLHFHVPKRLPNEAIVNTFLRTRLYVESTTRGSEEQINIRTLDHLTDEAEHILHIDTITRMRQQLATLYFFDNIDDSVDTDRILRWLRLHDETFEYVEQLKTKTTCLEVTTASESSQTAALNFANIQNTPIAPSSNCRAHPTCTICNDFDKFRPHNRLTCPSKNKCIICTVVRGISPEIVNHRTENHIFQRKRPPRHRRSYREQDYERHEDDFSTNACNGRGRPLKNRVSVPYPQFHQNPTCYTNDLASDYLAQSTRTRQNRPTVHAKNSQHPTRHMYTAAI